MYYCTPEYYKLKDSYRMSTHTNPPPHTHTHNHNMEQKQRPTTRMTRGMTHMKNRGDLSSPVLPACLPSLIMTGLQLLNCYVFPVSNHRLPPWSGQNPGWPRCMVSQLQLLIRWWGVFLLILVIFIFPSCSFVISSYPNLITMVLNTLTQIQ